MNNWFEHILFHARTQPETPAMVMEDRAVTYGMLGVAIDSCARRIQRLEPSRDAPVAVLVKNPIRDLTLALALFRLGLPSISIVHGQPGLDGVRASLILGDQDAGRFVGPSHCLIEVADAWFGEPVEGGSLPAGFLSPTDVCRLSLTSGSTGTPKLIAHRIADVALRVESFQYADWRSVLCMPGLGSSFGFTAACTALALSRTACFAESSYQAIRMVDLFAINAALVSPEQLVALSRVARKTRARLQSLRTVWVGGGLVTRALLEAAMTHLCHDVLCRYGASETGVIAEAHARVLLDDPALTGFVLPGVEIGVFDAQGGRCAEGQAGLVKVRRETHEGWTDLGDIGWCESDGRLYVLGRASEVDATAVRDIRARDISPVHEIEHLLRLEWDVADAAAVMMESSGAPAQVWAGVVGAPDASAERVEAIARARGLALPIRLFALQGIPRGVNGKVNRAQLKALLLAETGRKPA